jgi:hypothetical protein
VETAPPAPSTSVQKPIATKEKALAVGWSKNLVRSALIRPKSEFKMKPSDAVLKEETEEPTNEVDSKALVPNPYPNVALTTPTPVVKTEPEPEETKTVVITDERVDDVNQETSKEQTVQATNQIAPTISVPVVEDSFAIGLAASTQSSSTTTAVRGAGFFNPFGAYGSGSSDSDSD